MAGVQRISDSLPRGFDDVVRGSMWLFLSGVVVNLSGLVFWLVSSRLAGASGVGYAASAVSISGLVSTLLNLGLSYSMLREIPVRGSRAFSSGLLIAILLSLLGSIVALYTPLSNLYPGFSGYVFLAIAMTILSMISLVSLPAMVALNMARAYFLVNLFSQVVRISIGVPLVMLGFGGFGAALGMLSASIVSSTGSLAIVARVLGLSRPCLGDLLEVLRIGVSNYPLTLSSALVSGGVIAAGILTGDPGAAGVTYISLMISQALGLIPSSIASASLPAMMRGASPEIPGFGAYLSASLVLPIAVGIGVSSRSVLSLLGSDFSSHWGVLSILSLSALPYAAVINSLSRMNWERSLARLAIIGIASLAVLALLSPILAGLAGVEGVAIAYLASSIAPLPLLKGVDLGSILKLTAIQLAIVATLSQPPRAEVIDIALGIIGSSISIVASHMLGIAKIETLARALAIAINRARGGKASKNYR